MKKFIYLVCCGTFLTTIQYNQCMQRDQLPLTNTSPDATNKKDDTLQHSPETHPYTNCHFDHETLQLPIRAKTIPDCHPPTITTPSTDLPEQLSLSKILEKYDPQNILWHPDGIVYTDEHFLHAARRMLTNLPPAQRQSTIKKVINITLTHKLGEYFEKLEILEINNRPPHTSSSTSPCCYSPYNPHCTQHIRGTHVSNPEYQIWTHQLIYSLATGVNLFNSNVWDTKKGIPKKLFTKLIHIEHLLKIVTKIYDGKK